MKGIVDKWFGNKWLAATGLLVITGFAFTNREMSFVRQKPPVRAVVTDPQDTFPVPSGNINQLFYLQRNANTNTIVCELNYDKNGQLDKESPVHVFWLRYQYEGGIRKELNYIQRNFAYGIKSEDIGNGNYRIWFVSYKKIKFLLTRSPKDNKYYAIATINQKPAILRRMFVKVDGGSFWAPNVVYMELKGTDPVTGKEQVERFTP
jgi:hypothetical protein